LTQLRIHLLGQFAVILDGRPVLFEYEKVRALLAYLAMCQGEPIQRERLATFLWPDAPAEASKSGLRQALARLRSSLGVKTHDPGFFTIQHYSVQLNRSRGVWVDALEFQTLLQPAGDHRHRNELTCTRCMSRRARACEFYRGDFLA
jgi:DNA-binding SARP family transcriptional activator